jgi:hypothetical protein
VDLELKLKRGDKASASASVTLNLIQKIVVGGVPRKVELELEDRGDDTFFYRIEKGGDSREGKERCWWW